MHSFGRVLTDVPGCCGCLIKKADADLSQTSFQSGWLSVNVCAMRFSPWKISCSQRGRKKWLRRKPKLGDWPTGSGK